MSLKNAIVSLTKSNLMYPFLHVYEHVKFCIDSITLVFFSDVFSQNLSDGVNTCVNLDED
jgi:hypothetical protein